MDIVVVVVVGVDVVVAAVVAAVDSWSWRVRLPRGPAFHLLLSATLQFQPPSSTSTLNAPMLPVKRRRLDPQFSDLDLTSPPQPPPYAMSSDWQRHVPAYTPSDSTEHPAFASPLANSWTDGFSHDPGFLASQEELRCMLFTIAQSAAPTRASSPVEQGRDAEESSQRRERAAIRPALSSSRRVEYLKNYVGQVAPWVSRIKRCHGWRA